MRETTGGSFADSSRFPSMVDTTYEQNPNRVESALSEALSLNLCRPLDARLEYGGLNVQLSSTALQALTDAVLYVKRYPFECTEAWPAAKREDSPSTSSLNARRRSSSVVPDFEAELWLGDTFVGEQAFRNRSTEQHQFEVPMSYLHGLATANEEKEKKGGQEKDKKKKQAKEKGKGKEKEKDKEK
ncbi:hypothetical protein QOT17_016287 [Balamuthia mandrillaris]